MKITAVENDTVASVSIPILIKTFFESSVLLNLEMISTERLTTKKANVRK
jgi:hypothetical protein